jgi:hypothetical protein
MHARPLHGLVGIQASSFKLQASHVARMREALPINFLSIRRTETYSRILHIYTFPFPPQLPLLNKARWGAEHLAEQAICRMCGLSGGTVVAKEFSLSFKSKFFNKAFIGS